MRFCIYYLFYFLCTSECFADESKFELIDDDLGIRYIYEIEEYISSENALTKGGKISVFSRSGNLLSVYSSERRPGCYSDFPAISIVQIATKNFPFSNESHAINYAIFCGNSDGKHNVLSVYHPYRGFVATLDFNTGPVVFELDKDNFYRSVVEYQTWVGAVVGLNSYPVVYKLKPVGRFVGFSDEVDSFAFAKYKQVVEEGLKVFHDVKKNKSMVKRAAARVLLTANISSSTSLYCETKASLQTNYEMNDLITNFVKEIELHYNLLSCEGEL